MESCGPAGTVKHSGKLRVAGNVLIFPEVCLAESRALPRCGVTRAGRPGRHRGARAAAAQPAARTTTSAQLGDLDQPITCVLRRIACAQPLYYAPRADTSMRHVHVRVRKRRWAAARRPRCGARPRGAVRERSGRALEALRTHQLSARISNPRVPRDVHGFTPCIPGAGGSGLWGGARGVESEAGVWWKRCGQGAGTVGSHRACGA